MNKKAPRKALFYLAQPAMNKASRMMAHKGRWGKNVPTKMIPPTKNNRGAVNWRRNSLIMLNIPYRLISSRHSLKYLQLAHLFASGLRSSISSPRLIRRAMSISLRYFR